MNRLPALIVLLLCVSLSAARQPWGLKSLSATMSMRQATNTAAFASFITFNRRRRRPRQLRRQCRGQRFNQFRTQSGFCNNLNNPDQGAAEDSFLLLAEPLRNFETLTDLPNPRTISNIVCEEASPVPNDRGMSELVTFFGQIIDHTFTFIPLNDEERADIPIPSGDPVFAETQKIPFLRTITRDGAPLNELSSYVDAASVYGVAEDLALLLREGEGGRLSLPDNLLPRGTNQQFLAGDERSNENPNLTALHLLFAREHNRVAAEVATAFPDLDDEDIYQLSRHIVAAEMQAVVYYEFIPALTGSELPRYTGYRRNQKGVISNEFSTVAFRVGHTLLNSTVTSISSTGEVNNRLLRDSFFNPDAFVEDTIEGLFRGMMSGQAAEVDNGVTGEVRNFLVDSETSVDQLDLVALNIQRGRDHGVQSCNDLRVSLDLPPFSSFSDISSDSNVVDRLSTAYGGNIDIVDPWICGVSEDHEEGSSLGALFNRIVRDEFQRLRDADRFYFETNGYFTPQQRQNIATIRTLVGNNAQLGGIMRKMLIDNTDLAESEINANPFMV